MPMLVMVPKSKMMLADKHFPYAAQSEVKKQFLIGDSCTGRTTRIVDECIQELLSTGSCHIQDHDSSGKGDMEVLRRIKNRMSYEHPYFTFDYSEFTLTLKEVH